jgi:hypothetical protein
VSARGVVASVLALAVLFAAGFSAARAFGTDPTTMKPATLRTVSSPAAVTVTEPVLRGVPADLATTAKTTVSGGGTTTGTSTGTATGTGTGNPPPSNGGTTTFSPGDQ